MTLTVDAKLSARSLQVSLVKPITVLIVDDHQLVREGFRAVLNEDPAIQVIGEAGDGAEGIELALRLEPDVILMDIQMPQVNGLEAAAQIKAQLPCTKVVMLTVYSNDSYVIEAVRAGAAGYVLKDSSSKLLCETIKNVYAGHVMIKSEMLRQALNGLVNNPRRYSKQPGQYPMVQPLSDRETQVLKLVMEGQTNRRIGISLCITEATVKKHIQSIITKLGALDRTHAAVKAIRSGIIN